METLQIEKTNALTAYNQADKSGKELLSNLFGKKVFQTKITDRIKTFEDACDELGIFDSNVMFGLTDTPDVVAYKKLKVITAALNEGWTPNWDNSSEEKWRLWFWMDKPGFRLRAAYCDSSRTTVGSRLCFKSKQLALYAAEQFKDLYEQFFTK